MNEASVVGILGAHPSIRNQIFDRLMPLNLRRTLSRRKALWAVIGVALLSACGKTEAPTQPEPVSKAPPALTAIRLSGPTALAPGATAQFTAIAERSDGSSENVTATASWNIWWSGPDRDHSGPNALRFISPGIVQGVAPGEASVNVQIPFQSNSPATSPTLSVLVLEPGTFRISGTVTSAGIPESAAIEIVSGTGSGLRTTSDNYNFRGQYALYGAAGTVELRASANGFDQQIRRIVVTGNTTSDFDLNPLVSPTDISGSWVVTLSASPSCRANTPEVAWQREFDVSISQQGTRLSLTRTSPTFYESCTIGHSPGTEEGRIFGQTLSSLISGDTYGSDYSYPCLFDRLSPTEWLGISGFVQGTVAGSVIRGTLDTTQGGAFDLYESPSTATAPVGPPKAICHAKDHSMTLRRK
jgi:hypothetical protein